MSRTESAGIIALRETVCALHAELVRNGLVAWTSGNVSARLANSGLDGSGLANSGLDGSGLDGSGLDGSGLMVIKPSGVSYDDLTPESMVVCDLAASQ